MNRPTHNDTGFHPAPGYILVEVFVAEKVGDIIVPNKAHEQRNTELETVYVLEDGRVNSTKGSPILAPGTRVLVKGGGLFSIVPGRKLSIVDAADLLGVFDARS